MGAARGSISRELRYYYAAPPGANRPVCTVETCQTSPVDCRPFQT
jgi:hypothetical protein